MAACPEPFHHAVISFFLGTAGGQLAAVFDRLPGFFLSRAHDGAAFRHFEQSETELPAPFLPESLDRPDDGYWPD
jgi:hypothetical protein